MSLKRSYLVGIGAMVGCASGAAGTAGGTPRSGDMITSQEVANFPIEGRSAYDIVQRLRPRWLSAHSAMFQGREDSTSYALVFLDGRANGRPNSLRDIPAEQVSDMRYYDVAEAQGKYGARGASGVIEVRLKRSPN